MKRRIVAYKNYYKDFFESLDAGTQEKILYGMHLNWKQNMKKANDIEMFDVDAQLDAVFGKEGSPERAMAEERANAFFTGQIIEDARKRANITQEELAQRIGSNKSYISRVERGRTEPKVSTFYRIVAALGFTVELTPAVS